MTEQPIELDEAGLPMLAGFPPAPEPAPFEDRMKAIPDTERQKTLSEPPKP